jgi:integrase
VTKRNMKNQRGIRRVGESFEARRYELIDGKKTRKFRTFSTLIAAKKWQNEKPKSGMVVSGSLTYEKVEEDYFTSGTKHLGPATKVRYQSYRKHFKALHGKIVAEIGPRDIDALILEWMRPEYLATQNATRIDYAHEFSVVKNIFLWYQSRENRDYALPFIKDHNRMIKVEGRARKFKVNKDLKPEEFLLFLKSLEELCKGKHSIIAYLPRFQYMIFGRAQEAAALHVEDFNLSKREVVVDKKIIWTRAKGEDPILASGLKAGDGKIIPLTDEDIKLFQEYLLVSGVRSGPLFPWKGGFLPYRVFEARYTRALKAAGLEFSATHIIRHASLKELQDAGKDLLVTKEAAAHSDSRTTERYATSRIERIREAKEEMQKRMSVRG